MKFSELQDFLREAKGITALADIARELGVSPQSVSNWKTRDQVPYKYVLEIRKKYGNQEPVMSSQQPAASPQFPVNLYPPYYEEETISLREIIDILKKNWKTVIITPTVTCIISIIYVLFIAQPVYVATAKIIPSMGGGSTSQLRGLAARFGVAIPGGETGTVSLQLIYPEILQSRTLARALLKHNFDTEEFGPDQPLLKILTYGEEEPEFGPDTLEKIAVKALLGMIDVSKDRQSSILTLELSASEPQLAADIATVLIEELDRHQQQFKNSRVSEKRQFIEGRIAEVQVNLEKSEEELKQFRDRNRQIQNSPALLLKQERFIREVEVEKGIFITLKQEYELAKIQEVEEVTVVHVLDPPEAPLERSKPKRKQTVILAGILGIGGGIGIVFAREYWKNSTE